MYFACISHPLLSCPPHDGPFPPTKWASKFLQMKIMWGALKNKVVKILSPEFLALLVWHRTQEFAFLIRSQELLMLTTLGSLLSQY